jgi:hypothetical protein
MAPATHTTARERVRAHAADLLRDRIRIGGAACGDPLAINSLLHVRKPLPGLHAKLAAGCCRYALEVGETDDEERQIRWLRDEGFVSLWSEGEYLLQCIGDFQRWKRRESAQGGETK